MVINKIVRALESKLGSIVLFSVLFLFLFVIELNYVGLSFLEKITIQSTLDFSWFSDGIERLLHGYVLGKDFTFTYGPLFQFLYALPSILFHVPSYVSVALSPLISFVFIFLLVLLIAKYLTKNVFEQTAYILFLFIMLGLLVSSSTDTVKMLIPVAYSFILYSTISKKLSILQVCVAAFLPTFFGLYAYNLFVTCLFIAVLLICIHLYMNRKNWREHIYLLAILPCSIIFQVLFSLLFTHSLDYTLNSLDAVRNFRYVLDLTWTTDRSNISLVFPVSLLGLGYYLLKTKQVSSEIRSVLLILILV